MPLYLHFFYNFVLCNRKKRMYRLFITFLTACLFTLSMAQTAKSDFTKSPALSGGCFAAYPGPQQQRLTPAPKGKHPFHISHYGRHGSRHHTKFEDYNYVLNALEKASREGALTLLGEDVLQRVRLMRQHAEGHIGELTPLGASQHRDIARRMYERFPQVFKGHATVDARSTLSVRCLLSMTNALLQLQQLNPRLQINTDASQQTLYYMAHTDRKLTAAAASAQNREVYDQFCREHPTWQRLTGLLFCDTAYVNNYVNGERLCYYLFRLAANLQSTDLALQFSLYDLFTADEIYDNWQKENAYWYLGFGFCPMNGAEQPYGQRVLLRTIIQQADSCLRLPHPSAMLRYGHDTMLLPLVCLLGINGYGQQFTDPNELDTHGWRDYQVIPMAGNLQFIFYRKNASDDDPVFKVLLNEDEATLPLPTDMAPYYHWRDFRDHYLQLIDAYDATHSDD